MKSIQTIILSIHNFARNNNPMAPEATPPAAAAPKARDANFFMAGYFTFIMGGFAIVYQQEMARRRRIEVERQERYFASLRVNLTVSIKAVLMKQDENHGPRKKRRPNRYNWQRARDNIQKDYFGPLPTFDDGQFARTFRVTKAIAEEMLLVCGNHMVYFTETVHNITKQPNIDPKAKLLIALKTLAYGVSPTAFLDYFQMGDTTACECLIKFCQCIRADANLQQRFMRPMSREDAKKVCYLHFMQHGVDGMIGSIDCMHVYWKNCPMAWRAVYGGKEKAPTIVLEAFADYHAYIWHAAFGYPGSSNDINILERSPLLATWLDGSFHRDVDFEYTVNGQTFKRLFLLADGIYPDMSRFVETLGVPIGKEQKRFAAWQESSRKDIERTFGILQRKFNYLCRPFELWELEDIKDVVLTCILMHNWMVTVRVERDELESADFYEMVPAEMIPPAVDGNPPETEDVDLVAMHEDDAHYGVIDDINKAYGGGVVDLEAALAQRNDEFFDEAAKEHHYRWMSNYDPEEHKRLRDAVATQVTTKVMEEHEETDGNGDGNVDSNVDSGDEQ